MEPQACVPNLLRISIEPAYSPEAPIETPGAGTA